MNKPSACSHFTICSGCQLQEPYSPPIWHEALAFFQKHGVEPEFVADGFSQTRTRAKLAIRKGPAIGLFKRGTHEVIGIPECLLHHPSINKAAAVLREEICRQAIAPYDEASGRGLLRYAQFSVELKTGRVQLALAASREIRAFCEALSKNDLWHSIWQNIQPASTNTIFGSDWSCVHGETFLWQPINAEWFPFHPAAFCQAHLSLFEKMVQKIRGWIEPNQKIIELYAGVGVIGLSLPSQALTLVENNPFARLSFLQLKKNAAYLCMDAKQADLSGYDLTIVDPPRKGLDPEIIPKIRSSRLIYVSCQFSSFKRDAEKLFFLGWKLKRAAGYLMFPGANHVEILGEFYLS